MLRREKKKKGILSDRIANLLTVAPNADVEDDLVFNSKPKTVTKEELCSDSDRDDAATLGGFRKRNVPLLADVSGRYAGEVVQRDHFSEADDESRVSDAESECVVPKNIDSESQCAIETSDESQGDESRFDDLREKCEARFRHAREADGSEGPRGEAVRAQLRVWEGLLEQRIAMQRVLATARRLPLDALATMPASARDRTRGRVADLLARLLELQSVLLSNYPETKNLLQTKKPTESQPEDLMDEEITSDSDSFINEILTDGQKNRVKRKRKLNDRSEELVIRHKSYSIYRNSVIQKWDDKTRAAAATDKSRPTATSALAQIEYILRDRERLTRRTRVKRTEYQVLGEMNCDEQESDAEPSSENFDDDDFYHQLLRELIERKSADISDPVQLSRQWVMLQQLRSKMKRKVDTRATKGRRIRYAVHPKLLNFTASQLGGEWPEATKNELFTSLFGRQFEGNVHLFNSHGQNTANEMSIL